MVYVCYRYVEELMRMMVCADVVDFNESDDGTNLYYIPPWKRQPLQGSILGCFYVPLLAAPYSKLVACFLKEGPHGTVHEEFVDKTVHWRIIHKCIHSVGTPWSTYMIVKRDDIKLHVCLHYFRNTVVSRYYYDNVWYFKMLLIMIPDQYPNYHTALEICTG